MNSLRRIGSLLLWQAGRQPFPDLKTPGRNHHHEGEVIIESSMKKLSKYYATVPIKRSKGFRIELSSLTEDKIE